MPRYFKLRIGLSRDIEDGQTKKTRCTELVQYFCQDAAGLCSVTVCEDGFIYMSPVLTPKQMGKKLIRVPTDAVPCSAGEYAQAYAQFVAAQQLKEVEQAKAKALAALLKTGKLYASEPEPSSQEPARTLSLPSSEQSTLSAA